MTILNPKIKEIIQQFNLDEKDSYFFCLMFWFKKYYPKADELLFTTLKEKIVINLDNEEDYRTNFLKLEDGEWVLKYPLFVKDQVNSFDSFVKKIAETRLIGSRGHVNNQQEYAVYDVSKETREAFNQTPGLLDLDKAVEVVIKYYETTKPAQKFSNYLSRGFIVDYNQYEQ